MLRGILIMVAACGLACGDNESLDEIGSPDAGLSTTPGDGPGDDTGDQEPVDDDEPEDDSGLACSVEEITPILECAFENCVDLGGEGGGGLPGLPGPGGGGSGGDPGELGDLGDLGDLGNFDLGEILSCAAISCFPELLSVSPECSGCLFELIGGGEDALEACGGDLGGGIPGLPGGDEGGGGLPGGLPF